MLSACRVALKQNRNERWACRSNAGITIQLSFHISPWFPCAHKKSSFLIHHLESIDGFSSVFVGTQHFRSLSQLAKALRQISTFCLPSDDPTRNFHVTAHHHNTKSHFFLEICSLIYRNSSWFRVFVHLLVWMERMMNGSLWAPSSAFLEPIVYQYYDVKVDCNM